MHRSLTLALLSLLPVAACTDAATDPTAAGSTPPAVVAADDPTEITVTDLLALGVTEPAVDINNREQVVGGCLDRTQSLYVGSDTFRPSIPPTLSAGQRALLWSASEGVRDLGSLGGGAACAAAINDAGQVVGYSLTGAGETRAFVWSAAGGMRDLGTLPGSTESRALDINSAGQAVGWDRTADGSRAVVWAADGTAEPLGVSPAPGTSRAVAINDAGQVTGTFDPRGLEVFASRQYVFLWTAATGARLFSVASDTPTLPLDINRFGLIVGLRRAGDVSPLLVNTTVASVPAFQGLCSALNNESTLVRINSANVAIQNCSSIVGGVSGQVLIPGQPARRLPAPPLPPMPGSPAFYDAYAFGLNDVGQVVGTVRAPGRGATLWTVPGLPAAIDGPVPTPAPVATRLRPEPAAGPYRVSEKACGGRYTVCVRFSVADGVAPYRVTINWGDQLGVPPTTGVTYDVPSAGVPLLAPHDYAAPNRFIGGAYVATITVDDARGARTRQIIRLETAP